MAGKYTNKFPKVGNEAYAVRAPAAGAGTHTILMSKKGNAKGGTTPDAGTATRKQGILQPVGGASYHITVSKAYLQTDARTQANGRIMPPVRGSNRNFRTAAMYGPMA